MDYTKKINEYLKLETEVLSRLDCEELNSGMNEIVAAYEREGNIYIFGNGGSAATASHFVADFNRGISENLQKKFRFFCLNDNIPAMLAIANDFGYEDIFRHQMLDRLKPADLVIGISGSGNSANVVNALQYAKDCGIRTLGITGYDGGKVRKMVDVSMHVPVDNMQVTEDVHMIFDHMMMTILCATLR